MKKRVIIIICSLIVLSIGIYTGTYYYRLAHFVPPETGNFYDIFPYANEIAYPIEVRRLDGVEPNNVEIKDRKTLNILFSEFNKTTYKKYPDGAMTPAGGTVIAGKLRNGMELTIIYCSARIGIYVRQRDETTNHTTYVIDSLYDVTGEEIDEMAIIDKLVAVFPENKIVNRFH